MYSIKHLPLGSQVMGVKTPTLALKAGKFLLQEENHIFPKTSFIEKDK